MSTVSIDAEWGSFTADLDKPGNWVKFVNHLIEQLEFFQLKNDTEYIRRDLKGYKYLRDRNDDDLVKKFIQFKVKAKENGERFEDNIMVLKAMGEEIE